MEICWLYFSLRVRWIPGHDNPAKNFIQLPGTDVVDKLARIVGAGSNKSEWWTRPFSLNNWGESAFVAKLQGLSTAKRLRVATVTVGCNEQIEVATTNESLQKRSKKASLLPALHPPCRLSSEGSVLTSLGNLTKIIANNAENFGIIKPIFSRQIPSTDPLRIQLRAEVSLAKYSMNDSVKTRAYINVARLHRKLSAKKHAVSIEDRASMGLPQIRRKRPL